MILPIKIQNLIKKAAVNFNPSIFKSEIHGYKHSLNVMLYSGFLGYKENLTVAEIKILLECAKYHDVGRINDNEDLLHGMQSADYIKDFQIKNKGMVLEIIKNHCLPYCEIENINDLHLKKLIYIFKDADALDRIRFNDLDKNKLSTKTAKDYV